MGKIKQGILGGFSGKVGTVVGASWKGISYMRSIPQHVHNPRTEGQVNQRSKFSVALHFLQPLNDFIRTGYKLYAHRQSPFNSAMAYTLANATSQGQIPMIMPLTQARCWFRTEILRLLPMQKQVQVPATMKFTSTGWTIQVPVLPNQPTKR
jgi:hypothetical protein